MLPKVSVSRHTSTHAENLQLYRPLVGDEMMDEIFDLGQKLKGLKVCQVNATASGGGVAELLARQVPIMEHLGIRTDWRIMHADDEFFNITKNFHNALQGMQFNLNKKIEKEYLEHNQISAKMLENTYDVYFIHDPQPAAIRHFIKKSQAKWIWRCHIDSSDPNQEVWQFLRPYIERYDAAIFTMDKFSPKDLKMDHISFIPPAIDPMATKNMDLPLEICQKAIADSGIDPQRPLLVQVSRFDPWKDPLGVIQVYKKVKEKFPDVQLALVGSMALDDPEGWEILENMNAESEKDPDMYVFTNLAGVGNMEVNAFQRVADVIIQKSLKEGFGLVITEAFWKEKAVVAGEAGGIPMQFPKGYEKYLINNIDDCAKQVSYLLQHPGKAAEFGRAGKEWIRQNFLLPRLIRDELRLIYKLTH